jgi:VanZ family protein
VAVGFTGLDEFHQSITSKRTGSVADVEFYAVGVLIAVLMVSWGDRRYKEKQEGKA